MPRSFAGTSDYIECSLGAADISGALTIALIAKVNEDTERQGLFGEFTAANALGGVFDRRGSGDSDPGALCLENAASNTRAAAVTFVAADGWCLVATTKATGTSTPRFHKVPLTAAPTIQHVDGGAALASPNGTITRLWFGRGGGGDTAQYSACDIAVAGVWNSVLTDSQIESLASSIQQWVTAAPQALWIFDQGSASDTLSDYIGGGANQAAISGTSVSTSSAPISYSMPEIQTRGMQSGLTIAPTGLTLTVTFGTADVELGTQLLTTTADTFTPTLGTATVATGPTIIPTGLSVTVTFGTAVVTFPPAVSVRGTMTLPQLLSNIVLPDWLNTITLPEE